jgi:hypothetical protein
MTDTYEQFMQKVLARPLPTNPMTRLRTMAKEMAEGAAEGWWNIYIYTFRGELSGGQDELTSYFEQRWKTDKPNLALLLTNEYLQPFSQGSDTFVITRAAFDLIDAAEPASIFISYRRKDSSAFALLILARLKMAGLEPFLDLSLEPGENWQQGLQNRLKSHEYFVLLLGPESLASREVQREIAWALEAGLKIIPIWHSGFSYPSAGLTVPDDIDRMLRTTHTIRVLEESALGYNNAIVELLNRFGVTP